jgi:Ribonuclease G/E
VHCGLVEESRERSEGNYQHSNRTVDTGCTGNRMCQNFVGTFIFGQGVMAR